MLQLPTTSTTLSLSLSLSLFLTMSDAGLWLPSQNNHKHLVDADFCFPSEFPYEFGVSSPAVESVAGSTETESSDGEEDFLAGLTRRLSQTSLHETRKQLSAKPDDVALWEISRKCRGLVGSPQSTLSGIGSWSGRSGVSGDGSPNGYSRVPSPSTTPFDEKKDPWEVIYAAAGEVARLKIKNNQVPQFDFPNNRALLTHPRPNQSFNQTKNLLFQQQCGSVWGREAKANWLVQNRAREFGHGSVNVKCTRPLCLPQSAWPTLQVQHHNNRVQFAESSVKRPSGGTGVFLPRHYETPSESRKKTGSAPVLLPAKVVHALNLNIDDLNRTSQPRFSNAFATDYDAILARRNALLLQQRLSVGREESANYEIRLPQEMKLKNVFGASLVEIKHQVFICDQPAGRFLWRYGYGDTDGAKAQGMAQVKQAARLGINNANLIACIWFGFPVMGVNQKSRV
ncbi:hypothetical protein CR513_09062, partial [Mucuna pruriens]